MPGAGGEGLRPPLPPATPHHDQEIVSLADGQCENRRVGRACLGAAIPIPIGHDLPRGHALSLEIEAGASRP